MLKKPATNSKDWHAADVIAAVKKTGTSLHRLSRENHLGSSTLGQALYKPYPKSERIIAEYLGIKPHDIWPSRYNLDGSPKSGRGERGLGRHHTRLKPKPATVSNNTPPEKSRNVYVIDNEQVAA